MQHQAQTVTVHNDGQVPCHFEFIQKLDEPAYCKPWLTANPSKGFLAQGETAYIHCTYIHPLCCCLFDADRVTSM